MLLHSSEPQSRFELEAYRLRSDCTANCATGALLIHESFASLGNIYEMSFPLLSINYGQSSEISNIGQDFSGLHIHRVANVDIVSMTATSELGG